jgi:YhcH/YjgK/YiaL family protein
MILDSLDNAALYHALGARIAAGLRWLTDFDPDLPVGRYPIEGDLVHASVQSYETAPGAEKRYEAHRNHVDIQCIVSGRERILVAPTPSLTVSEPYREEKDVTFYADPSASTSLLLSPGDFAILFPGDAHKPGCMAGGRDAVRKVVVKVRL